MPLAGVSCMSHGAHDPGALDLTPRFSNRLALTSSSWGRPSSWQRRPSWPRPWREERPWHRTWARALLAWAWASWSGGRRRREWRAEGTECSKRRSACLCMRDDGWAVGRIQELRQPTRPPRFSAHPFRSQFAPWRPRPTPGSAPDKLDQGTSERGRRGKGQ